MFNVLSVYIGMHVGIKCALLKITNAFNSRTIEGNFGHSFFICFVLFLF